MASIASPTLDNTVDTPGRRTPLVTGNQTYASVTHMISRISEESQPLIWWIAFAISFPLMLMFGGLIAYLILTGVGVWGNHSHIPKDQ